MPVGDDRVYGLKGVIGLVQQFMTRVERDGVLHSPDFPVLVVVGFRGSGKTAVLSRLADLLHQVPHARLDLEMNRHASVPAALSAIAFDLSRKYPKYELRFPRFIAGQLVAGLTLDLTDHSQACKQVEAALAHHRDFDTIREVLVNTAGSVLTTMGARAGVSITPPTGLLRFGVGWLSRRAPGRQLALGPYQSWYGHRDLGLHQDSIDVLVDLNRWANDTEDEDAQTRVDELLWAAFLADLRAEFGRGRQAAERSLNCVVLLDNADTELGRRFLGQLVQARRQRAVGEQDDADPLTVVATSRGALLADVPEADRSDVAPAALHAWRDTDVTDMLRVWWLALRLPDLTEDEVARAAADTGLSWGNNQRISRVVYQLTGGHPAATSLVLDALARSSPRKWLEPEAVLGRADQDAGTVEEQILDRLLTGVSAASLRDLVTCAPARKRAHALALADEDGLLTNSRAGYDEIVDSLLWPEEGSAGLTLLRRLLVRVLARRGDDAPSWSRVHGKLRHASDDETDTLYYALADGELGFVVSRLHDLLAELTGEEWCTLVTAVAAAPYRVRRRTVPIDEVRALVDEAGPAPPAACVARLVAGLHLTEDPFTDSRRRDVHLQIADDYAEVARLCPGGPHAVFLDASRRHRREAEWWD